MRRIVLTFIGGIMLVGLMACSSAGTEDKVIIYSNGDEEATDAMETALDEHGYEGEYIMQTLGTSELGGKLMIEGNKIEADVVTMASYFIDSAQEKNEMFLDIESENKALEDHATYQIPILANMGSLFVNTQMLEEKNLPMPSSIKDLTDPVYEDMVSIPNIMDSSTAWLFVQAVLAEYGADPDDVLTDVLTNVGPHLESSGSGPLKKVQTGEAAVGFGLRAQAVDAKADGIPIDFIDPVEGNFSLVESIAVVDKEGEKVELAKEMAQVIAKEARPALLETYPAPLYEGEEVAKEHKPAYPKKWEKALTVELLEEHQEVFNKVKERMAK